MKHEKLNLYIGVFLSCSVIYIIPFVVIVLFEYLNYGQGRISFSNPRNYNKEILDIFSGGLIIGTICTLAFAVLDWRKKSDSLFHIILTIFFGAELCLVSLSIYALISFSLFLFSEVNFDGCLSFIKNNGLNLVRFNLWTVVFSFITGIIIKKLLTVIRNKKTLP